MFAGTPEGLNVQIVNKDVGVSVFGLNISVSDAFITQLDSEVMTKHYTNSVAVGKEHVRNGSAWALFLFHTNFSQDSLER